MTPIVKADLNFKNRPNLDNFSFKKWTKIDLPRPIKQTFSTIHRGP